MKTESQECRDLPEDQKAVKFAHSRDEENYKRALRGFRNEFGVFSIVVITSSRLGSGKSSLAREILVSRFGGAVPSAIPSDDAALADLVLGTVEEGLRYLWFDNVRGRVAYSVLATLDTSKEMRFGISGSPDVVTREVDLQVVLCGNDVELSADLAQRALFIELV